MRAVDVSGQDSAIFEADHSSSPLLKIASSFLRNTLLGRLQGEAEVRCAAVKLLDDAVSVAALVLIRARIFIAHAEAHRPVEENGDLSRRGCQGLGLADTCGKAPANAPSAVSVRPTDVATSRRRAAMRLLLLGT